jgi:hypothetical protein
MWEDDPAAFAQTHKLTLAEAGAFRCTAEHLKARKDGGRNARRNIVAACLFCNQQRHRSSDAPSPSDYKHAVQQRLGVGR